MGPRHCARGLSKPPYEPLREASLKHLTLKTVFLIAMASGGRCRELQALVFDPKYIQFKPKGAVVTLYFSPKFMRKNQRPKHVHDPCYISAVPTGKSGFDAPTCPVRALRYYQRYMTEHAELRKGRRCSGLSRRRDHGDFLLGLFILVYYFYSCGLSTATIEYSPPSVCSVSLSVCLSFCVHDNSKNNGSTDLKLEHIVVNENSSDEFDIGHCPIKVKVTA